MKCFFDKLQCQNAKRLLSEVEKSETKVIAPKKGGAAGTDLEEQINGGKI